jgi:hypothetical protein
MWNKNVQDWRWSSNTRPQAKAGGKASNEKEEAEAEQSSKTKEKITIMVAEYPYYWKQLRELLFINLNLYMNMCTLNCHSGLY